MYITSGQVPSGPLRMCMPVHMHMYNVLYRHKVLAPTPAHACSGASALESITGLLQGAEAGDIHVHVQFSAILKLVHVVYFLHACRSECGYGPLGS